MAAHLYFDSQYGGLHTNINNQKENLCQENGIKVLSLFDGMACGMLALLKANVAVSRYVAYEIDKYAVETSTHNFPFIEHRGDVFEANFSEFDGFDLLVGGSPCTYWSIAQKNNRETEASGLGWELFSQYVRAVKEAQPAYFIYENNKSMSNAIKESITNTFGFEPVHINSALVSAQNRQRLYWVGKRTEDGSYVRVNVNQPKDMGIYLRDILDGMTDQDKSRCMLSSIGRTTTREYFIKHQNAMTYEPVNVVDVDKAFAIKANYFKSAFANFVNGGGHYPQTGVAEPVNITDDDKSQTIKAQYYKNSVANFCAYTSTYGASGVAEPVACRCRGRKDKDGNGYAKYECRNDQKANTLDTNTTNGSMIAEPVYVGELPEHNGKYRNGNQASQQYRVFADYDKSVCCDADSRKWYAIPVDSNTETSESETLHRAIPCIAEKYGYLPEMFNAYNKAEIVDKAPCLSTGSMVTSSCAVNRLEKICFATPVEFADGEPIKAISGADGKAYTVYKVINGIIEIKDKQHPIKLKDGYYIIRKLTVNECKRLQTVQDWYEFPVSDTQAYKMLGNGWTVNVIAHLIQSIKTTQQNEWSKLGETS